MEEGVRKVCKWVVVWGVRESGAVPVLLWSGGKNGAAGGGGGVLVSKPPTTKGVRSRDRHLHSLASDGCEV